MSAAAHGHEQVKAAPEIYSLDHVAVVNAAGDQGRVTIDYAIPNPARFIVIGRARLDQLPLETGPERFDRFGI